MKKCPLCNQTINQTIRDCARILIEIMVLILFLFLFICLFDYCADKYFSDRVIKQNYEVKYDLKNKKDKIKMKESIKEKAYRRN